MVERKSTKVLIRILRKLVKFNVTLARRGLRWLVRSFLISRRRRRLQGGFVLPTTTMLLLVVTLVTAAVLTRSLNRTTQVVGDYQAKEIYNAASPAIDRAKAKLEALFNDSRLPNGVPAQEVLLSMMLNDGSNGVAIQRDSNGQVDDKYTLPREKRLDINGDGKLDNAWSYQIDSNQDGKLDQKDPTIAYSIILQSPDESDTNGLSNQKDTAIASRASRLLTRNGPFSAVQANQACRQLDENSGNAAVERGWFNVNAATLRKNFQVNAVVIPAENQRATAALEFQQDRQLDRGNKWGGWFRGDLEIFPGPQFNWNGALHTEGSLIVGDSSSFTGYLISAPSSCLYTRDASEITVTQVVDDNGQVTFQGQVVNGSIKTNTFAGSSIFHLFNGTGTAPITSGTNPNVTINNDSHSVNRTRITPADVALDPVPLYTQDVSRARRTTDPTNTSVRRSEWNTSSFVERRRIFNQQEPKPYVDDTYRADNRYGPKPNYGRDTRLAIPGRIGELIRSDAASFTELTSDNPIGNNLDNLGLDGYWERRARREGLRIIVGQRLELANPLGQPTGSITNEARQRRALRDNLAAVQASAIYHYKYPATSTNANDVAAHSSGYLPVACLATTAHPGTAATINNSTTFNSITINGTPRVNTDFLTGNGTNGWEFNPPAGVTTDSAFANAIAVGQPLRKALTNLAYFAGDPFGAFPARQDTATNRAVPSVAQPQVHPHPVLTQWGNFSELRRVIALLDSGTTYADLSLADKTTLHTASCMMGMLAYNLQNIEDAYKEIADDESGSASTNALGVQFSQLMDGVATNGNPEIGRPSNGTNICTSKGDGTSCPSNTYNPDYFAQFTAEEWINALSNSPGLGANRDELLRKARLIFARQQILRDRTFGFQPSSNAFLAGVGAGNGYNAATGRYTIQHINAGDFSPGQIFRVSCDPNSFIKNGKGNANGLERARLGLTMAFCSQAEEAKYPSLFYLFPVAEHDHCGEASATALAANPRATVLQPNTQPYVANTYIFNNNVAITDDVNHGYFYRVIDDTNGNGIENGTEDSIKVIALQPRTRNNWLLPNTTTTSGRINIIRDNTTSVGIPFLDKGMFNGREMMSVRVLDIDLDLLRRNTIRGVTDDAWLPKGGIVYAFREDAVREDGIARPAGSANSLMNANTPQDPPITSANGITTKPVDYYADPDRRPYGFRLRNGTDLRRVNPSNKSFTIPDNENIRGISFISDNPVYIQGDFNLHLVSNTNTRLEEFSQLLQDNYSNFYSRSTLDERFARPNTDTWRPSEILADAVTILSDNFCDGGIQDSFTTAGNSSGAQINSAESTEYGCPSGSDRRTSYLNQNRPRNSLGSGQYWLRENDEATSPIRISVNGNPMYCGVDRLPCPDSEVREYTIGDRRSYYTFSDGKSRNPASDNTRVNAIIISGIVPSQAQQSYGGLHNFPRFLESWSNRNLYISGAFLQLNFSTYATAPFDQDAWEPGAPAQSAELIQYYGAPNRRWGYDVGLQYAPAGPVSRRFVTTGKTRSEFYRELNTNDPYIKQLRCAKDKDKKYINQNASSVCS